MEPVEKKTKRPNSTLPPNNGLVVNTGQANSSRYVLKDILTIIVENFNKREVEHFQNLNGDVARFVLQMLSFKSIMIFRAISKGFYKIFSEKIQEGLPTPLQMTSMVSFKSSELNKDANNFDRDKLEFTKKEKVTTQITITVEDLKEKTFTQLKSFFLEDQLLEFILPISTIDELSLLKTSYCQSEVFAKNCIKIKFEANTKQIIYNYDSLRLLYMLSNDLNDKFIIKLEINSSDSLMKLNDKLFYLWEHSIHEKNFTSRITDCSLKYLLIKSAVEAESVLQLLKSISQLRSLVIGNISKTKLELPVLEQLETLSIESIWDDGGSLILNDLFNLRTLSIGMISPLATFKLPKLMPNLKTLIINKILSNAIFASVKALDSLETLIIKENSYHSFIRLPDSLESLNELTFENIKAPVFLPETLNSLIHLNFGNIGNVEKTKICINLSRSYTFKSLFSLTIKDIRENSGFHLFCPINTLMILSVGNVRENADLILKGSLDNLEDLFIGDICGISSIVKLPDSLPNLKRLKIGHLKKDACLTLPKLPNLTSLSIESIHEDAIIKLPDDFKFLELETIFVREQELPYDKRLKQFFFNDQNNHHNHQKKSANKQKKSSFAKLVEEINFRLREPFNPVEITSSMKYEEKQNVGFGIMEQKNGLLIHCKSSCHYST